MQLVNALIVIVLIVIKTTALENCFEGCVCRHPYDLTCSELSAKTYRKLFHGGTELNFNTIILSPKHAQDIPLNFCDRFATVKLIKIEYPTCLLWKRELARRRQCQDALVVNYFFLESTVFSRNYPPLV